MTDTDDITRAAQQRVVDDANRRAREAQTATPALPALSLSTVDLDQLRAAAPALRTQLIEALRADVTERREGRGPVVVPEDTYPVVRRLTAAEEVLRQFAQAFADAAKEAAALIAEEATIALGESDGIPNGSLFVPDGVGQRIAVSNDWDSNAKGDVWDLGTLVGWLAEDQTEDAGVNIEEDGGWTPEIVAGVARDAMNRLLALGRFSPSVKAVEALRLRAAEREDDATAALLRQIRTRGERIYRGVKITREPMPKSQR
jgi:hypothetical protein